MLTSEQINDLHRLYWSERWPIRKIERHLQMGWRTIRKYLEKPAQAPTRRQRTSKLDPFKPRSTMNEIPEEFGARASVIVIPKASHALIPEQPAAVVHAIVGWIQRLP